jgi:glutathione S-transferase
VTKNLAATTTADITALARLPYSFRTVNLETGVQRSPNTSRSTAGGLVPCLRHRGLTILPSNVILDYLARMVRRMGLLDH